MFNETSYFGDPAQRFPIKAFQGGCAAGTNMVDVGGDAPVCLSPTEAQAWYASQGGSGSSTGNCGSGLVAVNVGADAPVCMTSIEAQAYGATLAQQQGTSLSALLASLPSWAVPVGLAVLVLMVVGGARRR